jgi:hypothetical protein
MIFALYASCRVASGGFTFNYKAHEQIRRPPGFPSLKVKLPPAAAILNSKKY